MILRATFALLVTLAGGACGAPIYVATPTPLGTLGAPPSNSAGATLPAPSASPGPSIAPATAGPGSGELFFALFAAIPPPFHVRLATTLSGSPSGTSLTEADADAADYSAQLHVELVGVAPRDSQVVFFDGVGYVADVGSDDWRAYPDYETVPPVNPFLDLDPTAWQELGTDPGHAGLDQLHSTAWRLRADSSLVDRVENVIFDVWIDTEGLPVDATLSFTLPALDLTTSVGYQATYQFTNVGDPVQITPPTPLPSP